MRIRPAMRAVALTWMLCGIVPPAAHAEEPRPAGPAPVLSHEASRGRHVLTIAAESAGDVEIWVEGTELLMSFPHANPALDAVDLQDRLSGWVESVSIGYDTVLLRLFRGVRAEVETEGSAVQIRLSGDRADGATDDPSQAAQRLDQLRVQLRLRQDELERERADRASVGVESRHSRGGPLDAPVHLEIGSLRLVHRLAEAWRLRLESDLAHAQTDRVQRASGVIAPFAGERARATLAAQHDGPGGWAGTASVFAGSRAQGGAGVALRRDDEAGSTTATLEWRRPNWDYVEGLIDGVARDRLAMARAQRWGTDLTARLEIGQNRYRQANGEALGESAALGAELRLSALGGLAPLSLVYSLSGEYFSGLRTRIGASGQAFSPLPLVNREIHLLTLGYTGPPWATEGQQAWSLDAYAGLGADRYGRNGALAAATLTYRRGALEIQMRAAHVVNVGRIAGRTDSLGVVFGIRY